jgi:hypothetical protein
MKGKDGKNNDHVDEQKLKSFENDSYLPMFALWQELKYYLFMVNLGRDLTDIRLPTRSSSAQVADDAFQVLSSQKEAELFKELVQRKVLNIAEFRVLSSTCH